MPPESPAHESRSVRTSAPAGESARERDLRFVIQVHRLRTLGLALGFLCVAPVLRRHDEPLVLWLLLGASSFLWPHVARSLAIRSTNPARSERLHLTLDSALGGTAIALMQFNLLPSALLVTMLSMDKIAVGGIRFWLRTVAVLVAACILTSATLGFAVDLETPTSVLVSCIPLLVTYPLLVSYVMHALAKKVAIQNTRLAEIGSTDELTGLANRRQGLVAAGRALASHQRNGRPATSSSSTSTDSRISMIDSATPLAIRFCGRWRYY